ncbi:MAG: hypothetical protein AB2L21_09835 [Anaerolineaceae bacterium]|jgi:hypothetical protein
MKTNFLQAYKQAPWRVQLQWIGIFLLILVCLAVIAGGYLSISGRAAASGRHIQELEGEVDQLELEINDLQTQLAYVSSARSMRERLKSLNMVMLDPMQALYLEVPGYQDQDTVVLAPAANSESAASPIILPEFTSSLWDWLSQKISEAQQATPVPTEVLP